MRYDFQLPAIIADIGGTNARFVLLEEKDQLITDIKKYQTKNFDSFGACVAQLKSDLGIDRVHTIILAIAGPISGQSAEMTNNDWVISLNAFSGIFKFDTAALVNDFSALAYSIPYWKHQDLAHLGGDTSLDKSPKLVMGPGTGFGMASVVKQDGLWVPLETEAGHMSLGPETDFQSIYWPYLEKPDGRITIETLISGSGLSRLYAAILRARTGQSEPSLNFDPANIANAAVAGQDRYSKEAFDEFCILLGRVAGDMALAFGAMGGVYIAGGIIPQYLDYVKKTTIRAAFENKAPMTHYVDDIPLNILTHPYPGLFGLQQLIQNETAFSLSLSDRVLHAA